MPSDHAKPSPKKGRRPADAEALAQKPDANTAATMADATPSAEAKKLLQAIAHGTEGYGTSYGSGPAEVDPAGSTNDAPYANTADDRESPVARKAVSPRAPPLPLP